MSEINWDLAPDGAVAIKRTAQGKMFFHNSEGKYYHGNWKKTFCDSWKTIATRPTEQKKTVADAYEWNALNGSGDRWQHEDCEIIIFHPEYGINYSKYEYPPVKGMYVICTREQFEAYAKEQESKQEGEKWTHTHLGDKCRVIHEYKSAAWVVIHGKGDRIISIHSLKPIKPKLTEDAMKAVERFAYSLMDKESYDLVSEVNSFREYHEIIEGPAND